jgi:hypothetical protein
MFNFSADGVTDTGQNLDDGQFAYLDAPQGGTTVPEPSSLLVLHVAFSRYRWRACRTLATLRLMPSAAS